MYKKLYYYFNKTLRDLFNPLIYDVKKNYSRKQLGEYYFLFRTSELLAGGSYEYSFDEYNIPIVKGHISDTDGSYIYQPQAIGQFALALYNDYCTSKKKEVLTSFLNLADWFLNNYQEYKGIPYWNSTVKKINNVYGEDIRGHKISSMSQSRAISVLMRAYVETENIEYLDLVEKALVAYKKTPEEGGFLDKGEANTIYFEEASQPRILNHLIFSIWGLYDYCQVIDNVEYKNKFHKSIQSIIYILSNYDYEWWSLYDDYKESDKRRVNPCTRHYHQIHIQQLCVLYNITGNKVFEQYYNKWKKYDRSFFNRFKMLLLKIKTVKSMGRL